MEEEIDTCMRLLGVTSLDQLGPEYVFPLVGSAYLLVEYKCSRPYGL
jgi:isopentenyl diphosphate isomerase/L-lactate dehydrogenase-like FMN-dependent dehydrogenase